MRTIILRFWLVFHLAEEPDEIDVFGGLCTLLALPLNLTAWLTDMTTINALLSIVISVLSLAWLAMRVFREWDYTKAHIAKKYRQVDETEQP